jgi:hypothetical protein
VLIRFTSEVGGFIMFGDVALQLLRMSGHSGSVPGAIGVQEMAQALLRLEAAVLAQNTAHENDAHSSACSGAQSEDEGQGAEASVSLARRAFPLLELMRRASAEACAIQWRAG